MSTDVIQISNNHQTVQRKALKTYLWITVPMILITFLSWYGVYWLATRRDQIRYRTSERRDEEDKTNSET